MAVPAGGYPHRAERFGGELTPMSGIVLVLVGLLSIGAAIIAADVMERGAVRTDRREVVPVVTGPRVDKDGAWERNAVEPPFAVEDLQSTSFGLVAATGPDGIWISRDGRHWEQSLAILNVPVSSHDGPATTSVGPEHSIMGAVKAVVEFDSALYAFGNVSSATSVDSRAWLVGWRSVDGDTWEQISIADGWDRIIDATASSEGLTLFARARRNVQAGGECCVAALHRSRDGENWVDLTDALVGLKDVQLWAATSLGDGYLAIGSSGSGDVLFSSSDGITWQAVAKWRDAAPASWQSLDLHESAWAIVDLFEGPDGVMAVTYSERRRKILLLTSADGAKFHVFEPSSDLLEFADHRADAWPPLTAPEGATHNGRVVLLGEWYPKSANAPCTHFWRWTPPAIEEPGLPR